MQFVNDDMDEMFRQAAKEYPLKTDSEDWIAVLNKMQSENDNSGKKNNGEKYFFLLLLIPLLIICSTYIKNDSGTVRNRETKAGADNYTTAKNIENNKDIVRKNSSKEITAYKNNKDSEETIEAPVLSKERKTTNFFTSNRLIAGNNSLTKDRSQINGSTPPDFKTIDDKLTTQASPNVDHSSNTSNANSVVRDNKQGEKMNNISTQEQNIFKESTGIISTPAEVKTASDKSGDVSVSTTSGKKERQPKERSKKLYFGFQVGPDFSMVKSFKIDGIGYSAGLLLGYNITKKLALETGVLWDHKRYQSEGRYFSTEKLNWPHVYLLDISGFCNMYEIPLNLRYNFSQNNKRIVFATAGVSSYLMKKENYDYRYVRYGTYGYGNREYKNTVNNWLSVAHASIGLQKNLRAIGDVRVEPYVKLPLNGVGIGSMPLRSAGIYLGITRPIR